ncbi:MAG: hypothetical protein ACREJ4_13025 [Candidatus Methylomirabilaceae bacterium]
MRMPLGAVLIGLIALSSVRPADAHWADLAVAEILVADSSVQMILVFPTGLVSSADGDGDGRLSPEEVRAHRDVLTAALVERIVLRDGEQAGALTIEPTASPPSTLTATPGGHSTLMLTFTWPRPLRRLTIHYGLFLPGVPTASCLATFLRNGRIQTFVFTPTAREVSFDYQPSATRLSRVLLAVGGSVVSLRGQALLAGLLVLAAALGVLAWAARLRSARMEGHT